MKILGKTHDIALEESTAVQIAHELASARADRREASRQLAAAMEAEETFHKVEKLDMHAAINAKIKDKADAREAARKRVAELDNAIARLNALREKYPHLASRFPE